MLMRCMVVQEEDDKKRSKHNGSKGARRRSTQVRSVFANEEGEPCPADYAPQQLRCLLKECKVVIMFTRDMPESMVGSCMPQETQCTLQRQRSVHSPLLNDAACLRLV